MKLTKRSRLGTVALAVGNALREGGIEAVLTGGACANVYTGGHHVTADVDFVLRGSVTRQQLNAAMATLGFERRGDRYVHPRSPYYVEFPRGPVAIGADCQIRPVEQRRGRMRTLSLSATDSCRDRLAAFYHWNDRQALRAAVAIALRRRVRMSVIQSWSENEQAVAGFDEFRRELQRARRQRAQSTGRRRRSPRR
ncbi:MAG: hypothetical protein JSW67_02805 [Candidatus Latescibacterota bacterium]|nr:MAG: hypothetical protein JSW67_02805 [Candidatus Latescibacterota bacterium]